MEDATKESLIAEGQYIKHPAKTRNDWRGKAITWRFAFWLMVGLFTIACIRIGFLTGQIQNMRDKYENKDGTVTIIEASR